jgi:hypothetical protein
MLNSKFDLKFNLKIIFVIVSLLLFDLQAVLDPTLNIIFGGFFDILLGRVDLHLIGFLSIFLLIPSFIVSVIFGFKYSNGGILGFFESGFFLLINGFFSSLIIIGYLFIRSYMTNTGLFQIESLFLFLCWILIPINQLKKSS